MAEKQLTENSLVPGVSFNDLAVVLEDDIRLGEAFAGQLKHRGCTSWDYSLAVFYDQLRLFRFTVEDSNSSWWVWQYKTLFNRWPRTQLYSLVFDYVEVKAKLNKTYILIHSAIQGNSERSNWAPRLFKNEKKCQRTLDSEFSGAGDVAGGSLGHAGVQASILRLDMLEHQRQRVLVITQKDLYQHNIFIIIISSYFYFCIIGWW